MQMPKGAADLDAAKDKLHARYVTIERRLTHEVDELANSGFASKHWCSIARQHFEEGVLALHRALRDFPGDDQNQYGKVPEVREYPTQPPVGGDTDNAPNISDARRSLPPTK